MTTISKTMEIKAPLSEVFTYFARPEHMADQFPENMGLNIIPLEVKNGFGVGTIVRISGDFDGKKLEWDCETIDYVPHRRIVAKMIDGPFKRWEIVVEFEEVTGNSTKIGMRVDYDMPLGPLGGLMDKVKLKKTAERGMENGLYRVKSCCGRWPPPAGRSFSRRTSSRRSSAWPIRSWSSMPVASPLPATSARSAG